ncbi:HNH endonuclease [Pseudomonas mosselii]|uniref:HNH endonuclease n=1 Tax=Pseudomonas mosselii TaxID=78327 RepID=UPI003F311A92
MSMEDKLDARISRQNSQGFSKRGNCPAAVDGYVRALLEIEPALTKNQRKLLVCHASAPGLLLTMAQMAKLVGFDSFRGANRSYGNLGTKLTAALGIPSPRYSVYAIANFDDDPESGASRARMYPELHIALQKLGWINEQDGEQIQPGPAPHYSLKKQSLASVASGGPLSPQEIMTALQRHGFSRPAQSGLKVVRLEHADLPEPVFLKQSAAIHTRLSAPLVLHPHYEARLREWPRIQGLERGRAPYYHNSNLVGFPKRRHTGVQEISYGVDLGFDHHDALGAFISQLLSKPRVVVDSETEAASSSSQEYLGDIALTDTERDALIKARIGQGDYRERLLDYWGGCAVTECNMPELLRASHIKPWRFAVPSERLDPFNGLLLAGHLDLAFDQGLISFDDHGRILLSRNLDPASAKALNITPELRLRKIEARHRHYLAWHREHFRFTAPLHLSRLKAQER